MRTLITSLALALAACGPTVVALEPDAGSCAPWCQLGELPDGGQVVRCGSAITPAPDAGGLPWCGTCDLIRVDGGRVDHLDCY